MFCVRMYVVCTESSKHGLKSRRNLKTTNPGISNGAKIRSWSPFASDVGQGQCPLQIALHTGIVMGCIDENHLDFGVAKDAPVIQDAVKLQVDLKSPTVKGQ